MEPAAGAARPASWPPNAWSTWCSRSAALLIDEHHAAGRQGRAGHHLALRPGASRSPTCSASTTSSPPATASATAPTTARIDGDSCGARQARRGARLGRGARDVDLAESYAYCDSVYDTPLLGAVGHPVAVNPDPRLRLMATARRWPQHYLDVPPGVPKLAGIEPQQAIKASFAPSSCPTSAGTSPALAEHPRDRAGDPRRQPPQLLRPARHRVTSPGGSDRPVRFLGKKEVFDAPVVGQLARAMGGIRVERGTGSDEPLTGLPQALVARARSS